MTVVTVYLTGTSISQSFTSGDRGCFPSGSLLSSSAVATTTNQIVNVALLLGSASAGVTPLQLSTDMQTLMYNLCSKYGSCCYTSLCNSSEIIKLNQFNLIIVFASLLISKLYF